MRKLAILSTTALVVVLSACNQPTISALVSTLGNACSALASMQGNPDLAIKIKADTAAASADVLSWKEGTNSEMAVQAIRLLENDLNLICTSIPGQTGQDCQKYQPLIILALATADSIISIVQPRSMATAQAQGGAPAPQDSKEFKKAWNALVAANPELAKAKI